MRRPVCALAAWSLLCACDAASSTPAFPPGEPLNVLFVLLDDVGPELVRTYDLVDDAAPTPTLDRLAAEGVRFTQAYATPMCSPSRAALALGRHPGAFGLGAAIHVNDPRDWSMVDDPPNLMELLRDEAPTPYQSGLAGKWHLDTFAGGALTSALDHGFDHHYGSVGNLQANASTDGKVQTYRNHEHLVDGVLERLTRHALLVDIDDAITLTGELTEPWFVQVGLRTAHLPYTAPPLALHDYGDVSGDAPLATRAMVQATDGELQRLLDTLPDEVRARTVIIVMGDNGTTGAAQTGDWDAASGSKGTTFEAGIRVPLIITGPHLDAPGRTDDALVSIVDLMPTILDAAHVPAEVRPELDGISIWDQLLDASTPTRRTHVFTEFFSNLGTPDVATRASMRDERWKLVRINGEDHFYDLGEDWLEGRDLLEGELTPMQRDAYDDLAWRLHARDIGPW